MSVKHPTLDRYLRTKPTLGRCVYLAPGATVIGDVTLGDFSSVWFGAVLRADINRIGVGRFTNVQDNAVLHLADEWPCLVGDYVTIGHGAIVHACRVGDGTLIGMGACVMDGAEVGAGCLVGAKALVTGGSRIPDGSLVLGAPARVVRALAPGEIRSLRATAEKYAEIARYYRHHKIGQGRHRSNRNRLVE